VYNERKGAAKDKAMAAVAYMQHLSWDNQMRSLLEIVDRV
jgi:hypothetical protein